MKAIRFFLLLSALLSPALAQTQSQITGTITDNSGAVVVGAAIAARNVDTGVRYPAASNQNGAYLLPFLPPGRYELTCELQGFKKFVRSGLALETGSTATVNVQLELGQITESVVITASTPLIESETSSVGQLIERTSVLNMPVESRRGASLVRLMGNVVYREEAQGEAIPRFTMAGGRPTNQMWQLDGAAVQNMTLGVPILGLNPPAESLQEFKAEANNYSAEFGRTGGGLILMTTRSGTNQLHGAAYHFLRNDVLDARSFFSPGKAPLRYNIFGASVGGPVVRDKTFFFFNYEGTRRRDGLTFANTTVPLPANVSGDFSARSDVRVLDPVSKLQFPNNVIPASRIDKLGQTLAQLYPAPNVPINPARAPSNNYVKNVSDSLNQDFLTGRVDQNFGSRNRAYGRFSWVRSATTAAPIIPSAFADSRAQIQDNKNLSIVGSWINNLRPTLIHEFRYTHGNRYNLVQAAGTGSGKNGELGIGGVDKNRFARITVAGLTTLGSTGAQKRVQSPILTEQWIDTLTWVKGKHQLRTGFEFRYSRNLDVNTPTSGGLFGFGNRATADALAALLLGWVNSAGLSYTEPLNSRSDFYGAFVQDDWKVSSKLTLNAGLRWDMDTPRSERDNRQAGFNGTAMNPVAGIPGIITFAGRDGVSKYAHDFDKNNFGPRFGFAWRAGKKLAVRGGYGIAYHGEYNVAVPNSLSNGFGMNASFSSPDGGLTQVFPLKNGMPATSMEPLGPGYGAVKPPAAPRTAVDFFQKSHTNGYAQQWNLTIQKELPGNMLFETAYVANAGHKLGGPNIDINMTPLLNGRGPDRQDQQRRPFPQFNNVTQLSPPWGNSTYHSLNLKGEKRYSNGLNFLMNFTWAKFLDDVEGGNELAGGDGNGYQHIELRKLDKSYSGSDIRLRYVASTVYELPFGKGRHWAIANPVLNAVAGGWGVSVIAEMRSGPPWGAIEQTNLTNAFSSSQRPNLLRDPKIGGDRSRAEMLVRYFDTAAFQAPGVGIFGNAPREPGFGPGYVEVDASLHKRFPLREGVGLNFRGDFYNLPNRPNFANPAATRGRADFGAIAATAPGTNGRLIQLGMRLEF
ncbi:MAG: TonB-dependent receptor [Acidobacteria bacterium]|nr:TonB-dependent receptor [Acidobacteriota bacterium]